MYKSTLPFYLPYESMQKSALLVLDNFPARINEVNGLSVNLLAEANDVAAVEGLTPPLSSWRPIPRSFLPDFASSSLAVVVDFSLVAWLFLCSPSCEASSAFAFFPDLEAEACILCS